jgi:hypothetical protein
LKVQQFLNKSRIETPEDLVLQHQLFAYIVAKHYSISLTEVYQMENEIFTQSLAWALAVQEEEEKDMRRQQMQDNTSNETVTLDYTFLEGEDF